MTKSQLVESVTANHANFSEGDVKLAVDTVFNCMAAVLVRGDRIEIRGLGSFSIKTHNARDGLNPKTGERIYVPRKNTFHFTPGKELRERVENGRQKREKFGAPKRVSA